MKRRESLRKTIERKNNTIEGLSSLAINLGEKMIALETTVLEQKKKLDAKEHIEDILLDLLWDERRENERLRALLNEKNIKKGNDKND